MNVRCTSCHRKERRDGDALTVELAGGLRRPTEHPTLAAWKTLRKARHDDSIVVGPCVCGQPLLGDGPGDSVPWTLDTPDGPIRVDREITGPNGPLDEDAAEALLERHFGWRLALKPGLALFQGTLMMAMLGPMMLWVVTIIIVVASLIGFSTKPGFK